MHFLVPICTFIVFECHCKIDSCWIVAVCNISVNFFDNTTTRWFGSMLHIHRILWTWIASNGIETFHCSKHNKGSNFVTVFFSFYFLCYYKNYNRLILKMHWIITRTLANIYRAICFARTACILHTKFAWTTNVQTFWYWRRLPIQQRRQEGRQAPQGNTMNNKLIVKYYFWASQLV